MIQQPEDIDVQINTAIDLESAKERFQRTGRAQLHGFLAEESASRLLQCMSTEIDWRLAYNEGATVHEISKQEINLMSPADQSRFLGEINERASRQFQYAYWYHPVARTMNDENEPKFYTHDVLRLMNSDPITGFIKDFVGYQGSVAADGISTCFQSGQFLTIHDDTDQKNNRLVAYVLNMTPNWRPDWGGTLQFFDKDFKIVESFQPEYNVLNIFSVPQIHAVSYVAPYASAQRFAMTGWFHGIEDNLVE